MAYDFTEVMRHQVRTMAGYGLTEKQIADCMLCGIRGLRENCKDELTQGRAEAHAKIAKMIFELAMTGDKTMLIYFAKSRMGWYDQPAGAKHDSDEESEVVQAPEPIAKTG